MFVMHPCEGILERESRSACVKKRTYVTAARPFSRASLFHWRFACPDWLHWRARLLFHFIRVRRIRHVWQIELPRVYGNL